MFYSSGIALIEAAIRSLYGPTSINVQKWVNPAVSGERERDLELARTFNRILFKVTVQLLRKLQECTFVALWGSLNNVYLFVFLPTPNEISRLSLSPLGISTCDRSHIVHCCCALLIVFKEKNFENKKLHHGVGCREREWQRSHAGSLWSPVLGDFL